MTTLARITLGLLLALFACSCGFDISFAEGKSGNGNVVEDRREITEPFTEIQASEGIEVYVTQADDFEITVEGDENIIDLIGTDIRKGELKVHAIENIGRATKKVYVSLPAITALRGSSGSSLVTTEGLNGDRIDINASSGADLDLELYADEIDLDSSSGSVVNLKGESNMLHVDSSSGSNVRAADMRSKRCNADASSGSNVHVNVSDDLTADASSGANISYSGEAAVHKNKSVSGNISRD
ncbi:head GIN domain-containing protein [Zeaxanthinibacter enoshimensis]|uniref:Putative autotransporter adhesin-like protein n=1 Tax=Zeaxanthinibacter enoshimensis TaxID=392009 RepID=A0A4R6TG91_9FLAO|nr:head GIN domain-containing protein [Zeaxanthinibacter enoshimensis]TDQ29375.1 putative autotransporter adhesin-like protein [Zeaxanthinibacter enoshimensis]